jgi:hypothetical protein
LTIGAVMIILSLIVVLINYYLKKKNE